MEKRYNFFFLIFIVLVSSLIFTSLRPENPAFQSEYEQQQIKIKSSRKHYLLRRGVMGLTKDLYVSSIFEIYGLEINKSSCNPQYRDSKVTLEEVLNLKESMKLYKGFSTEGAEAENRAKFDKKEALFNSPFFLKLLFFFMLFCLIESLLKKKREHSLLDIGIRIPKISIKIRKLIILSVISIALILTSFFNYNIFNGEALIYTSLVKDFVDGSLKTNPINYADCNYMGGIPVLSFLTLPFFIMFNGTHLSLLVVCLLFKLIILILLYCFAYRFFGSITAAISAFLFVFSIQEFARFSMMGINAAQFHTILFVLSFVYVYFTIFLKTQKKTPVDNGKIYPLFLLLGFLGGISIYFDPSALITVIFCSFCMLIYERKAVSKKHYFMYFLSLLLGLSPRIFYMFTHNMEWVHAEPKLQTFFLLSNFTNNIGRIFPNFFRVFFFNLRRSFLVNADPPYISADILYLLFFISFCVLLINILQKPIRLYMFNKGHFRGNFEWQDKKDLFLLVYIIFYLVVVSFLPPDRVRARYLFPLFPFIFILIGFFLETIPKLKFPFNTIRNSVVIVVIFCIFLSGALNIKETIANHLGTFIKSPDMSRVKGYSVIGYMDKLKRFFVTYANQNIYLQDFILCGACPSDFSSHLLLGIYIGDKMEGDLSPRVSNLIQYCIDPEYIAYVYKGLAISYTNRFFSELYPSFKKGAVSKAIPKEFQQYFYTNFGFRIGKKYKNNFYKAASLIDAFPKQYESYLYRGLIFSLDEKSLPKLLRGKFNSINKNYRPLFFRQLGRIMGKDRRGLSYLIKEIPEEYVSFFLQGAGSDWPMDYEDHPYFAIKKRVKCLRSISDNLGSSNIKYLYEGIGLEAGIREAMFPNLSQEISKCILDKEYLPSFYKGYGKGLFIQTMNVPKVVNALLKTEIESRWFKFCYDGVKEEARLYQR